MTLRLYLDECVDHRLARFLIERGHEVLTAQAAGMLGAADDEQLRFAARRDLLILSHNQRHFRAWHARFLREDAAHSGVLLVPFSPLPLLELRTALLLDWIATIDAHRSRLFRWTDLQQVLAGGYRLPGYTEEQGGRALAANR